jgi:hypothetical protein
VGRGNGKEGNAVKQSIVVQLSIVQIDRHEDAGQMTLSRRQFQCQPMQRIFHKLRYEKAPFWNQKIFVASPSYAQMDAAWPAAVRRQAGRKVTVTGMNE